jgi:hypothetical protein
LSGSSTLFTRYRAPYIGWFSRTMFIRCSQKESPRFST